MLHLGEGGRIDPAVVDRCVSLVETTSPSGLLSGSLDAARRQAAVHGAELLGETLAAVAATREADRGDPRPRRCSTSAWSAGRGSPAGTRCGSRSTSAAPARPATGWRKPPSTRSGIDLELYSENVVVAIFGLGEPAAPAGERLVAALREAVGELEAEPGAPDEKLAPPPPWGELVMTPREAFLGPQEVIPFDAAAGRDRRRGAGRLPAGDPQRPPRRAADRRDARLHPRERRPRRLRARRQRPRAEDAAGRSLALERRRVI